MVIAATTSSANTSEPTMADSMRAFGSIAIVMPALLMPGMPSEAMLSSTIMRLRTKLPSSMR